MSEFTTIQFQLDAGVGVLILNRPDKLNSFNQQMFAELNQVFRQLSPEKGVRCLLLTGAGRGFCAGQDLGDRAVSAEGERPDLSESVEKNYNPLVRALARLDMPVVCAVNGVAAGAGSSIAINCDIVFAARSASFIQSFSKIGVIPDSGGTWLLPRLVGRARALGMALLGEKISAEQAEEWGLIWRCVDDEALMPIALETAKKLATQPTKGLSLIRRAMLSGESRAFDRHLDYERDLMGVAGRTDDYQEGISAFLQKRQPNYQGK